MRALLFVLGTAVGASAVLARIAWLGRLAVAEAQLILLDECDCEDCEEGW